ncbi:Telomerase reverse transcriptase [Dipsacomyces acuminosporus]|nr:Telomerase reverse transcriptase [Dipsacomyces acuminosporus]
MAPSALLPSTVVAAGTLYYIYKQAMGDTRVRLFHAPKTAVIQGDSTLLDLLNEKCPTLTDPETAHFKPAFLLPNADFQTCYNSVCAMLKRPGLVEYERELINTEDGGTIGLDWSPPFSQMPEDDRPVVVLSHGLSGGSQEMYIQETVKHLTSAPYSFRTVVVNFRGCAGVKLTSPVLYNAGFTSDYGFALGHVKARFPNSKLMGIGYSLGANLLTKFVGEQGDACPLDAAISVCNPYDLKASSEAIERPTFRNKNIYSPAMLLGLKRLYKRHHKMLESGPIKLDTEAVKKITTIRQFDDLITSQLFGYKDSNDYYTHASCAQYIPGIRVPFLAISTKDDPVCPVIPYDAFNSNPYVVLALTASGGHLGLRESLASPWFPRPIAEFSRAIFDLKQSVLASFYPCVSPLGEFMDMLIVNGRCMQEDDSAEFERFLKTTLVGHGGIRHKIVYYEPCEKLIDTVNKVIKNLLKRESSSSVGSSTGSSSSSFGRPARNILVLGYTQRDHGTMHSLVGEVEVSNHYINSTTTELNKPRWNMLLKRTGTEAMMYLLQHTSVFLALRNSNYNQICGMPITSMPMPLPRAISVPAVENVLKDTPLALSDSAKVCAKETDRRMPDSQRRSTQNKQKRQRGAGEHELPAKRRRISEAGLPLSLTAITIERGKMLYHTPRIFQGRVSWHLPTKFALNMHRTPSALIKQIFCKTPAFALSPPKEAVLLADRMLKLHKKCGYKFHLFRMCPAPKIDIDRLSTVPLAQARSLLDCDSDPEEPPTFHFSNPKCLTMTQSSTQQHSQPMGTQYMYDDGTSQQSCAQAPTAGVNGVPDTKTQEPASFLQMSSTPHSVYMFVQLCVQKVIPRDLIGGKRNHRRLYGLLKSLIFAGRFEALSLHGAMQGFRLGEASSWLPSHGSSSRESSTDIYASLICWILSEFAMPLIRSFFYVTESSSGRNELYFFRGDVWTAITKEAWRSLAQEMYTKKPLKEAAKESAKSRFGYSRIRLLPKDRGFRTIANLRRSMLVKETQPSRHSGKGVQRYIEFQIGSTNKKLGDSLAALTCMRKSDPELVGSSTFGIDDIYSKLRQFKGLGAIKPLLGKQRLYIAKVDIRRAYDTIKQEKLLELLKERLPEDEYMVYKYWTLSPSFGKYRATFLRYGQRSVDSSSFDLLASRLSKKTKQAVYGNQSCTEYITTEAIYDKIAEHITQNTVKAKMGLLQQRVGIPQGSVLSAFLCNFFYGQLEHAYLADIVDRSKTLMMRMIDDFIIVSCERSQVAAFLELMHKGIPEYGCELNRAKTLANFDVAIDGQHVCQAPESGFPWCGMFIDHRTLDVSVDYSRLAHVNLGMAITINTKASVGAVFRQKMLAAVRVRMYPLYMDCTFNSPEIVLLNLYQHFAICAMKFHSMYQRLPVRSNNAGYLIKTVWDTVLLAYVLLKSKCGVNTLSPTVVTWIGLFAFNKVLRRKQSRYTQLLALLSSAVNLPKFAQLAGRYESIISSPSNEPIFSINF